MDRALPRIAIVPRVGLGWIYLATFAVAFVILFLRLPEALAQAEFWADDGYLYTQALDRGAGVIGESYAGYLIIVQQATVAAQLLVPPALAPTLGNAVGLAVMAAVATYIALAPFPWPRGVSVGMAIVVLITPGNRDLIGTLSHVQWSLGLWVGILPFAREPSGHAGKVLESAALVLAGLTGPFTVLFLPLYLFGPRRRLAIVGVTAAVQLVAWGLSTRRPAEGIDLDVLPMVLALRGLVSPVLGPSIAGVLPAAVVYFVAAVVGLALFLAARRVPGAVLWRFGYIALVPMTLGIVNNGWEFSDFLNTWTHFRYFWIPGMVIGWLVVMTWPRERPLRSPAHVVLVALLAIGVTMHIRHTPREDTGWAALSSCIGGGGRLRDSGGAGRAMERDLRALIAALLIWFAIIVFVLPVPI